MIIISPSTPFAHRQANQRECHCTDCSTIRTILKRCMTSQLFYFQLPVCLNLFLINSGKSPALPGRQQKFDIYGSPSGILQLVCRQAHDEKGNPDGQRQVPKSLQIVVQLLCGVHSEMSTPHVLMSISPKYALSQVVGYIKGKSAIHIVCTCGERKRNLVEQYYWARGYFVTTVGRDGEMIRECIRHQEVEDKRIDQLDFLR